MDVEHRATMAKEKSQKKQKEKRNILFQQHQSQHTN